MKTEPARTVLASAALCAVLSLAASDTPASASVPFDSQMARNTHSSVLQENFSRLAEKANLQVGELGYSTVTYYMNCMARVNNEDQATVDGCFWSLKRFIATMLAETCYASSRCLSRLNPFSVAGAGVAADLSFEGSIRWYMEQLDKFINMCKSGKMPPVSEYYEPEDLYLFVRIFACFMALAMFSAIFVIPILALMFISRPRRMSEIVDGPLPYGSVLLQGALDGLDRQNAVQMPWMRNGCVAADLTGPEMSAVAVC